MDNERRRENARALGHDVFNYEVVEDWPGCVHCGRPIRRTAHVNKPGLWRLCDCQGIVWRFPMMGGAIERVREDEL